MPVPLQAGQRSSATFNFIRFIVGSTPGTTEDYQLHFDEITQSIVRSNLERLG